MSFISATRQNWQSIATLAYTAGQRVSRDIPASGLLAKLFINVRGTLTLTPNTGTITYKAENYGKPFALLDRVLFQLNSGLAVVNVSGNSLYCHNLLSNRNRKFDVLAANLDEAVTGNPVFQFGTANGSNTVEFTLEVPLVLNERDMVGLINLQDRDVLATLHLDWANVSNLFTLTNDATVSFTGNAYITSEFYDVPAQKSDYPDLSLAHILVEDTVPVDGTGEMEYNFRRGNIYMRAIHRAILNGAPAGFDDISSMVIRYNQTIRPYAIDTHFLYQQQRERYGRDLPKGVYVWDWFYQGFPGYGGNRDMINSALVSEFVNLITVASTATLGTNNNKIITLSEQLVPLAAG